jgi:hypothetical protein
MVLATAPCVICQCAGTVRACLDLIVSLSAAYVWANTDLQLVVLVVPADTVWLLGHVWSSWTALRLVMV